MSKKTKSAQTLRNELLDLTVKMSNAWLNKKASRPIFDEMYERGIAIGTKPSRCGDVSKLVRSYYNGEITEAELLRTPLSETHPAEHFAFLFTVLFSAEESYHHGFIRQVRNAIIQRAFEYNVRVRASKEVAA